LALERFIDRDFKPATLLIIDQANVIIADFREQGFTLTLRQLYYQFVALDLIPNKQTEYKRLGSIINDARLAGLIDWDAIEDRTRNVKTIPSWSDPQDIMDGVVRSYQEDLWEGQDCRVEVWIEKDALMGVVEPVCRRWRVPFFACRGYSSQSEQYAAGKRFEDLISRDITPIILHLGDHDPSGIDMTRDNRDRLRMFAWSSDVEVRRIALNMDQVEQYSPPPNPAKDTDSRAGLNSDGSIRPGSYIDLYGYESWELDALNPLTIDNLISSEIDELVNPEIWDPNREREDFNRKILTHVYNDWDKVVEQFGGEE
jgi:hypothetical protein